MVSRQLLHKKQSTDALVWCCLQNFTRDFLAEAIFHKSPRNYAKFVSASSVSFNLSNWTSLDYLAEESSFSRHFRQTSTALSSAVHRMASPTYYPKPLNQYPSSYLPIHSYHWQDTQIRRLTAHTLATILIQEVTFLQGLYKVTL